MKVHFVAAARSNFMKIASLYHELEKNSWCKPKVVHTGERCDPNTSDAFFRDLQLPQPHFLLELGSRSHAEQTGGVMIGHERAAQHGKPDLRDGHAAARCAHSLRTRFQGGGRQ